MTAAVNPKICPLCGRLNECARAADPDSRDCWCAKVEIPRELLEQIPEEARNRACICGECLAAWLSKQEGGRD